MPTYRASSGVQTLQAFGTTITPTLPVGLASGDLILASYAWFDSGSPPATLTTPTGYARVILLGGWGFQSKFQVAVDWKVAGGSESSPTLTMSHNTTLQAIMGSYTGAVSSSPIDGAATSGTPASSTAMAAPAFTTTASVELVVSVLSVGRSNGAASDISAAPTGETLDVNFLDFNNPTSTAWSSIAVATAQTVASSNWTLALAPVGAGGAIRLAIKSPAAVVPASGFFS